MTGILLLERVEQRVSQLPDSPIQFLYGLWILTPLMLGLSRFPMADSFSSTRSELKGSRSLTQGLRYPSRGSDRVRIPLPKAVFFQGFQNEGNPRSFLEFFSQELLARLRPPSRGSPGRSPARLEQEEQSLEGLPPVHLPIPFSWLNSKADHLDSHRRSHSIFCSP